MLQNDRSEIKYNLSDFLNDYSISYIVNTNSVVDHYHPCYKIVISLDQNFECMIDGQILFDLHGIIINQTILHSFSAQKANVLIILVKTDSLYGQLIYEQLQGKAWLDISLIQTFSQLNKVIPSEYKELSNKTLISQIRLFLNSLLLPNHIKTDFFVDNRIGLALHFINENLHVPLELSNVAAAINLSPGRTRHLFALQMGIPFSQYILWSRIFKVMATAINEDCKLSEVCTRFGFGDQSHFNHAYKRIFGLTPKSMIRSGRVLI